MVNQIIISTLARTKNLENEQASVHKTIAITYIDENFASKAYLFGIRVFALETIEVIFVRRINLLNYASVLNFPYENFPRILQFFHFFIFNPYHLRWKRQR